MNFKGHVTGGCITGVLVVVAAQALGADAPLISAGALEGLEAPRELSGLVAAGQPVARGLMLFALTVYMALFPDLDIRSTPQKWYLRAMFLALVLLLVTGQRAGFTLTALLLPLPLLHKHRGWTHWKITPWLICLLLAVVQEAAHARGTWFYGFDPPEALARALAPWPVYLAIVAGHATHLVLDARAPRLLPFVRNSPGHH